MATSEGAHIARLEATVAYVFSQQPHQTEAFPCGHWTSAGRQPWRYWSCQQFFFFCIATRTRIVIGASRVVIRSSHDFRHRLPGSMRNKLSFDYHIQCAIYQVSDASGSHFGLKLDQAKKLYR